MDNISVVENEYKSITGIGVKKIKLAGLQLDKVRKSNKFRKPAVHKDRIEGIKKPSTIIQGDTLNKDVEDNDFSFKAAELKREEPTEFKPSFDIPQANIEPEYKFHKKDEEIDNHQINDKLESKYKGSFHRETPVVKKEEVKAEEEVTSEMLVAELKKESYSSKVAAYKEKRMTEYNELKEKVERKEAEITNITNLYSKETEISTKLQAGQKEAQKVIDGINNLDLDFIQGKKDKLFTNVLDALESLFNEHRAIIQRIIQEQKNNTNRKDELGREEKNARNDLSKVKAQVHEFLVKTYPEVKAINEQDDELKLTANKITEFTGIKDERPNPFERPEETPVVSQSNIFDGMRDNNSVGFTKSPVADTRKVINIEEHPDFNPYNEEVNDTNFRKVSSF